MVADPPPDPLDEPLEAPELLAPLELLELFGAPFKADGPLLEPQEEGTTASSVVTPVVTVSAMIDRENCSFIGESFS